MRILFFGDVMGRSGRDAFAKHFPALKLRFKPDAVVLNAENAAAGHGVTLKIAQDFFDSGVDVLTTGNHVWNQRELLLSIDREPRLIRPLNFPEGTPGKGSYLHKLPDGRKLLVANLMGNLFMDQTLDDPFAAAENLVARNPLKGAVNASLIDFHAEATSEKMALAQKLDGRVSIVVGTHTHIPTADDHVLPGGTAYQTDVGMCGDYDSVIGVKKERSIWRFTRKIPGERMEPAEGEGTVCGCFIETDDQTGLSRSMEGFQIGGQLKTRPGL